MQANSTRSRAESPFAFLGFYTARVNRVVLTALQQLPVCADEQTFSVSVGMSQGVPSANISRNASVQGCRRYSRWDAHQIPWLRLHLRKCLKLPRPGRATVAGAADLASVFAISGEQMNNGGYYMDDTTKWNVVACSRSRSADHVCPRD